MYEKGLELSSDHAIVISIVDPACKSDDARAGLTEDCFYPPSNVIADYEKRWIDDIVNGCGKGIEYVTDRDLHELEVFNTGDGVSISE